MRKLLLATTGVIALSAVPGFAADMAVKAPPPPMPPPFTWTGFYIGGNIGGIWSNFSATDVFGTTFNSSGSSGFMGGGQVGYNWQFNSFVLGVEFDGDATSLNRTATGFGPLGIGAVSFSASTPWVTTLAARFGFAFDRWLIYGKAGGGWVDNEFTITGPLGFAISRTNVGSGWMLGGGIEYAIMPNWTVKFEYDYLRVSDWNGTGPLAAAFIDTFDVRRNVDLFKAGFNYKF